MTAIDGRTHAWANTWDLLQSAATIRTACIMNGKELPEMYHAFLEEASIYAQLAGVDGTTGINAGTWIQNRAETVQAENAQARDAFEDIVTRAKLFEEPNPPNEETP